MNSHFRCAKVCYAKNQDSSTGEHSCYFQAVICQRLPKTLPYIQNNTQRWTDPHSHFKDEKCSLSLPYIIIPSSHLSEIWNKDGLYQIFIRPFLKSPVVKFTWIHKILFGLMLLERNVRCHVVNGGRLGFSRW